MRGIWYNERANWLAGNATQIGELERMQADVLHKASESKRTGV
jgi:hypothetical protein